MMRPLRDRVVVLMEETAPTQSGLYIPLSTDKWRESRDQIAGRGVVVAVGEGRRHPKKAVRMPLHCKVGDVIRFSELQYPAVRENGKKYIVIMDGDIVGVERDTP